MKATLTLSRPFLIIPTKVGIQSTHLLVAVMVLGVWRVGFGQVEVANSFQLDAFISLQWSGDIIPVSDGNMILVGTDSQSRAIVAKCDQTGETVWRQVHRWDNNNNARTWARSVIETDGGFLVCGDALVDNDGNNPEPWLSFYDQDGEIQWERRYEFAGNQECEKIISCEDGAYAIAGWSSSQGTFDLVLIKLDSNCDLEWANRYQIDNHGYEDFMDCIQTSNGEFLLIGNYRDPDEAITKIIVFRIDDNGDIVWNRTYSGGREDNCTAIIETSNLSYLIAGYSDRGNQIGTRTILMEIDSGGDSLASKFYQLNVCTKMIELWDHSGYMLAGILNANHWLLRTDNNGDSLWCNEIMENLPATHWKLLQLTNGGYAIGMAADQFRFRVLQTTPDPVIAHRIPLRQGWNLLSSVCSPANPTIPDVWSEVVSRGNLYMAKNQSGGFYRPGVFNNMAPWDVRQGYMAKATQTDTLVIVNVPTETDTPIPLRQGWNLIAYFPEDNLDVRDALAGIADDILLVKDINGRFYRPANNFSNMPPLSRGNGYQVAVSQAVELVYPGGGEVVALASSRHVPPPSGRQNRDFPEMPEELAAKMAALHFHPVTLTGANMSMLLTALLPAEAAIHSNEIAAFTESGLCVGSTGVSAGQTATEGGATVGLAIWADDPTTPKIDGAVEGEMLTFKLWDGMAETPVSPIWDGEDRHSCLSFNLDGFVAGRIEEKLAGAPILPTEFALAEPYPNPFNSITTIRYSLPEASDIKLSVYDLSGREITTLLSGNWLAGVHNATWNAVGVGSGLYFVKLEAGTWTFTQKVMLVK